MGGRCWHVYMHSSLSLSRIYIPISTALIWLTNSRVAFAVWVEWPICMCVMIWAAQKCSDGSPGGVWGWVAWEGSCLFGIVSGRTVRPIWCRSLFRSCLNHACMPHSIGVDSKIKPGHYCDVTIMQLQICTSSAADTDVLCWHDDVY